MLRCVGEDIRRLRASGPEGSGRACHASWMQSERLILRIAPDSDRHAAISRGRICALGICRQNSDIVADRHATARTDWVSLPQTQIG